MTISIIVPVLNESQSIATLYEEIVETASQHSLDCEIVFVDDGSTDDSWATIQQLSDRDDRARGIRFRRNFGKAAALDAGARAAAGDIVITMDADLQDDPAEIPRFLEALNGGLDVVSGWKKHRLDPWHKRWPSRVFNLMVSWTTGLNLRDHNCGMKCYRAEIFREVRIYGELHRFIPVLAHARGFRVGELAIHHRSRKHGRSKYGVSRFIKGFLDLLTVKFLTGFGQRPQHLLGTAGLLGFLLGTSGLGYLAIRWLMNDRPIGNRPLLFYSIAALLLGAHMMSIGFLAELVTSYQNRGEADYSISEQTSRHSAEGDGTNV